ncbi:MAG: peroxiredoxin C [Legionellales bacterium]|nr:peroxiredoxin C [Legionellales bacterium]
MSILVGRRAPDFTVPAVLSNGEIKDQFNFSQATEGKHSIVFFYPLDFTFVCPSELIALDKRIAAFKERKTEVIAVSIDSQFTHLAYRNTPVKQGGIGPVQYTLAADVAHTVCQAYGVEHPEAKVAFRGAFVIDSQGIIRAQIVNDLPIGRNVDELLRLIDAVQFHEQHGEVCPAGWQKGDKGMTASPAGVADYLSGHAEQL